MKRSLLIASMVVLALTGVVSGKVCIACSFEEGCYPYSDIVDDAWYRTEVVDTSVVVSSPYSPVNTLVNNTSLPMPGQAYSYADVSGHGVTIGLNWRLINLGFREFSENSVQITGQYTVPPRSKVTVSTAYKYQDTVIDVERLVLMYCWRDHQLWTIPLGTDRITERNSWTALSLSEEPL